MTAYLITHRPRIRQFRDRGTKPSGVVVVHTAESTPDWVGPDAGAEAVARFIQGRTTYGSYHDLADSDSVVQLVPYSMQAYGDGTGSNPHAYHVSAATQAAKWNQAPKAWREGTVKNMAHAAAQYARWVKAEHGVTIPARRITRAQSDHRTPGFISHGERDPGRRTDPGPAFPWDLFLNTYAAAMGGTSQEDDMSAEDVWNHPLPTPGGDTQRAKWLLSQAHTRASGARSAATACLEAVNDLAALIGNASISETDKRDLTKRIARRTAEAVARLDAEAVAEHLEVGVKGGAK